MGRELVIDVSWNCKAFEASALKESGPQEDTNRGGFSQQARDGVR